MTLDYIGHLWKYFSKCMIGFSGFFHLPLVRFSLCNVRNVLYFYFGNICSKLKLLASFSAFYSDFKNLPFNVASQKKSWVRSGNWEENLCNLPFWIGKWHFFAEKNCKNLVLSHSENFFKRCQRPGFFKKKAEL